MLWCNALNLRLDRNYGGVVNPWVTRHIHIGCLEMVKIRQPNLVDIKDKSPCDAPHPRATQAMDIFRLNVFV